MRRRKVLSLIVIGVFITVALALAVTSRAEFFSNGQDATLVWNAKPPPRIWSDKALFIFWTSTYGDYEVDYSCNLDSTGWQDCNSGMIEDLYEGKKMRMWQGEFVADDVSPGSHNLRVRVNGAQNSSVSWTYVKPTREMACQRRQLLNEGACTEEFLASDAAYRGFPYKWGGYP